jgi:hypothetical protein
VPRMLGGILLSRVVDERRAPQNRFQLVGFEQEGDLLLETRGGHVAIIR